MVLDNYCLHRYVDSHHKKQAMFLEFILFFLFIFWSYWYIAEVVIKTRENPSTSLTRTLDNFRPPPIYVVGFDNAFGFQLLKSHGVLVYDSGVIEKIYSIDNQTDSERASHCKRFLNPSAELDNGMILSARWMIKCEFPENPTDFWETFPSTDRSGDDKHELSLQFVLYSNELLTDVYTGICEHDLVETNRRKAGCRWKSATVFFPDPSIFYETPTLSSLTATRWIYTYLDKDDNIQFQLDVEESSINLAHLGNFHPHWSLKIFLFIMMPLMVQLNHLL